MKQYHDLLTTILASGNDRGDRTGTGTRSCFGLHFRHNLEHGFPLLTTRKLSFKAVVVELLWFLRGDTNIKYLLENDVHIWTDDAYRMYRRYVKEEVEVSKADFERMILEQPEFARRFGDLGPMYGKQWRRWRNWGAEQANLMGGIVYEDQIKNVIEGIKKNPEGRRHIVTAWNPSDVEHVALPACHCMFQFYVHDGKLSCHMYQRSADVFLGVPFNIASYALLTHIVAHQCGLDVGELIISYGDIHIYNNHREQVAEQLTRKPKQLPTLSIDCGSMGDMQYKNKPDFWEYERAHFTLSDYDPHPAIHGELSVGV